MIEPDEDLRRVLRQWEAPKPGATLEARVWKDCRKSPVNWKWLPVAAGFVLAVGIAAWWPSARHSDPEGFQPLPNGAITVIKTGVTK